LDCAALSNKLVRKPEINKNEAVTSRVALAFQNLPRDEFENT